MNINPSMGNDDPEEVPENIESSEDEYFEKDTDQGFDEQHYVQVAGNALVQFDNELQARMEQEFGYLETLEESEKAYIRLMAKQTRDLAVIRQKNCNELNELQWQHETTSSELQGNQFCNEQELQQLFIEQELEYVLLTEELKDFEKFFIDKSKDDASKFLKNKFPDLNQEADLVTTRTLKKETKRLLQDGAKKLIHLEKVYKKAKKALDDWFDADAQK